MQMTIYDAVTVGSRSNCVYPNPVTVTDADTMRQAAAFDHVCAAYKQNYRSVDNFLKADCLPMDCDNDHSDDPDRKENAAPGPGSMCILSARRQQIQRFTAHGKTD